MGIAPPKKDHLIRSAQMSASNGVKKTEVTILGKWVEKRRGRILVISD
jgi:hypothetical protein